MEELFVKFQEWIVFYGIRIAASLAIFIFGRWIAAGFRSFLRKVMVKNDVDATLVSFVSSLVYFGLLAVVVIASLSQLGIQTASFVAVIGAAGLAIGLALQGSLANFAAGVLLIIFRPFKANDYIEGAGTAGTVISMGIFTTVLQSPDNKKIIVPNAKLSNDNIVNYSANDTRRVDMVFGVGYGDDLNKAKSVIQGILDKDERILKDPAPKVAVLELADSSINFVVRPWVKTDDYWDVYFDLQMKIKEAFDAEGISIPYPQQDLHIIQSQAA